MLTNVDGNVMLVTRANPAKHFSGKLIYPSDINIDV